MVKSLYNLYKNSYKFYVYIRDKFERLILILRYKIKYYIELSNDC